MFYLDHEERVKFVDGVLAHSQEWQWLIDIIVVALPICHLKDFIACHRIDLYTVISIKKEKGSEHPPDQSCALNPIKNHVHYNRLCPFTQ